MTKEQLVKTLRYCSAVGMCNDCWLTTIQKEFGGLFCDDKLKQEAADVIEIQQREINAMRNELCQRKVKNLEAADLIEQQAARIAELEAKVSRRIPVTEQPEKDGGGKDG